MLMAQELMDFLIDIGLQSGGKLKQSAAIVLYYM